MSSQSLSPEAQTDLLWPILAFPIDPSLSESLDRPLGEIANFRENEALELGLRLKSRFSPMGLRNSYRCLESYMYEVVNLCQTWVESAHLCSQ